MLVLVRRKGEQVMIGGDIIVEVFEVRGDRVKLGFTAPSDMPIHRREVYEAAERERIEKIRKANRVSEND
jgi:carbon storage regulator